MLWLRGRNISVIPMIVRKDQAQRFGSLKDLKTLALPVYLLVKAGEMFYSNLDPRRKGFATICS